MKVLVVSDSHGRDNYLEEAIKKEEPFDMFLHLGDLEGSDRFIRQHVNCTIAMVRGNNDFFSDLNSDLTIQIGSHKAFLTHGHRYHLEYGYEMLREAARREGADIVIFGHIHVPVVDYQGGMITLNPGSISLPRQEGHRPSYITIECEAGGEPICRVKYL